MMAQRNFADAVFLGEPVQRTAAQPRAKAAHGFAIGYDALHHGIGVLFDDVVSNPQFTQIVRQHMGRKVRLLLIEIDRGDLEAHRRAALQAQQHVEQGVGILAAGQAHHDVIAVGDHFEVADGLAYRAAQLRGKLLEIVRRLFSGWGIRHGQGTSRYLASR